MNDKNSGTKDELLRVGEIPEDAEHGFVVYCPGCGTDHGIVGERPDKTDFAVYCPICDVELYTHNGICVPEWADRPDYKKVVEYLFDAWRADVEESDNPMTTARERALCADEFGWDWEAGATDE